MKRNRATRGQKALIVFTFGQDDVNFIKNIIKSKIKFNKFVNNYIKNFTTLH
jgi:hypothetical protein